MKKFICAFISVIMLVSASFSASAWSVPGDLAYDDNVSIYFGEVESNFFWENEVMVTPVKVIKGDVATDMPLWPSSCSQFLIPGNIYIFASFNDGINKYVFFPDSLDTETLELSDRTDPYNEIEEMINSGRYKKADDERINKKNEPLKKGEAVRLSMACDIKKDEHQNIKTESNYDISFADFYNLSNEINVYPADETTEFNTHIIRMSIETENGKNIDLASNGRIRIQSGNDVKTYIINTEDRDKLLTLLPEEDLPCVYKGSIKLTVIITLAIVYTVVSSIIKKMKKIKKTKTIE